jgi:amino acid adenylation domain-containing protein/non-ribosomal peptide synthase protein (TIGR01720 family)
MNMLELLKQLKESGVNLQLHNQEELKIKAPKNVLTKEILAEIKEKKIEIIEFLRAGIKREEKRTIPNTEKKEYYLLSSAQKRMYFFQQMNETSTAYNIPQLIPLVTGIDIPLLKKVFQQLVQRHESLCTNFHVIQDVPVQRVLPHEEIEVEIKEKESKEISEIHEQLMDFTQPFDLQKGPLFRLGVWQRKEHCFLFLDMHHIISDATSQEILSSEFGGFLGGNILPENPLQYKDFAEWQNKKEQKEIIQSHEHHWLSQFASEVPVLKLPYDYSRPLLKSEEGAKIYFSLEPKVTCGLKEMCEEHQVTMFILLLAIFYILLNKLSGNDEIVVGIPLAGRTHSQLEGVVGMFVNTLAIRNEVYDHLHLHEYLNGIKENTLTAFDHQEYPFEELADKVQLSRDPSRNPVFDVMFSFQDRDELMAMGMEDNASTVQKSSVSKFDLTMIANEFKNQVRCSFEYCTELFRRDTIETFITSLKNIISTLIEKPDTRIHDIELIGEQEKEQLLYEFHNTAKDRNTVTMDSPVHRLFEDQAGATSGNIAIVYKENQISYEELNTQSQNLALTLIEKGMGPNQITALMVERTPQMISGILAIFKAGAGYMPIEPGFPAERIRFMLQDSGTGILLTDQEITEDALFKGEKIFLSQEAVLGKKIEDKIEINSINQPEDLAYIIYTSGTTGIPKGVIVEHGNLVNQVQSQKQEYGITSLDRVLLFSSFIFDASVEQIWITLISGAGLVLVSKEELLDLPSLTEYILKNSITHINAVPNYLQNLEWPDHIINPIKRIVSGGDTCPSELANACYQDFQFYNAYGPTETTITSTIHRVRESQTKTNLTNIGKPVTGNTAYIFDKKMKLQPLNVTGELVIGGKGVTRGYLNRVELTQDKYIPNPYKEEERLYKTGDLAKRFPNGNIEFIGRKDNQVKIRGYRIELGEIEAKIASLEGISKAVVIDRNDEQGQKYLCAYIEKHGQQESQVGESQQKLREALSGILPDYMIPSLVVQMKEIPLTPSGKVDKRALPEPDRDTSPEQRAPRNEKEELLCQVWQEVLGVKEIWIEDNFFEKGGDSIKAILIVSKLNKHQLKLTIRDLFMNPRIADLSKHVRKVDRQLDQGPVQGEVEFTPIQHWFFEQKFRDTHHFNQSVLLYRETGFQEDFLRKLLNKLTEHHDVLRMRYQKKDQATSQINMGIVGEQVDLSVFDLTNIEKESEIIREKANQIQSDIDLSTGPIVKAGLFKTQQGEHLLIVIHHLVVDGISWRILLEDIAIGYEQLLQNKPIIFEEKTDSFKKWSESLAEYAENEKVLREIPFWKSIEDADISSLSVDFELSEKDRIRKHQQTIGVTIEKDMTQNLLTLSHHAYNTDINDLLLTALAVAIYQWQGHCTVLINLEGHGREEIGKELDVSRTVGWFTTQYPVLLKLLDPRDISRCIIEIKERLRQIPQKGIGHGILQYLTPKEKLQDLTFNKKPAISFNYLGEFSKKTTENTLYSMSGISKGKSISEQMETAFLLNINGRTAEGQMGFGFDYNTKEYKESSIRELAEYFKQSVIRIAEHCSNQKETQVTPSDFRCRNLLIQDLEIIREHLRNETNESSQIEQIYPMSPMQQGMLFHSIANSTSSMYFEQNVMYFKGKIETNILEQSFNKVIERYDIFRTLFISGMTQAPYQVVLSQRPLQVTFQDLSGMEFRDQEKVIQEYKRSDKQKTFRLSTDHLLRILLLKISEEKYCLVWGFHHILMDGWCTSIIYNELIHLYTTLKTGEPVKLNHVIPYRNYIDWIENQSREEGLHYWKTYLQGYEETSGLPGKIEARNKKEYELKIISSAFSQDISDKFKTLAKEQGVTINTLFNTLWGIFLHKYNLREDAVFGVVVSGRPPEIEEVERIVGLFINTVPLRVRASKEEPFSKTLQRIHHNSIQSQNYDYIPLFEIQNLTPLNTDLVDHIIIFENYPLREELEKKQKQRKADFILEKLESFEQTNYDFNVIVYPRKTITLRFGYNAITYDDSEVNKMMDNFKTLVGNVVEEPQISIQQIRIHSYQEEESLISEIDTINEEISIDFDIST